eukprot:2612291-Pyramimonas_sp.AAC.1
MANTAQEASKRPPRRSKRPPRGTPGRLEETKTIDVPWVCEGCGHLLIFHLPTVRDGPRAPKDCPDITQEASKMALERSKRSPRLPTDGAKTAHEAYKTPKMASKTALEHPKRVPRWPREAL